MDYAEIEDYICKPEFTMRSKFATFFRDDDTGGLVLVNGGNYILTHNEINCMIEGLLKYYTNTNPSDIEEYNKMVKRVNQKEAESIGSGDRFAVKKEPRGGYIYFVKDDKNRIKIGKAINIKQRMGEYTKLPFEPEIVLLFKCRDYNLAELIFHKHFKDKRLRGEWFKLSKKDIDDLKGGSLPPDVRSLIIEKIAV